MENNKKLKEQIKLKIAISEIEDEEKDVMNKKNFGIANKIAAVVCLCLLTSGIVFAKDKSSKPWWVSPSFPTIPALSAQIITGKSWIATSWTNWS